MNQILVTLLGKQHGNGVRQTNKSVTKGSSNKPTIGFLSFH